MPQATLSLAEKVSSIEDYKFEPIRGYPMLQWKGKRPFTGTQFYPAQRKESYGEAQKHNGQDWLNKIFWGDNLQVMSHLLKQYRGQVDLVYIDPPFDSKADYKKKISLKGKQASNDQNAFEEKQYTDIWTNDEYLQFMYERLVLIRELLSEKGSIYVHCDDSKNAYLKLLLIEIFGESNIKAEIRWQRVSGRAGTKHFPSTLDTIFACTKSDTFLFNHQYLPLEESYVKSHYNQVDETGRLFRWDNATAEGDGPARIFFGEEIYPPKGTHWRWTQENINALIAEGKIGLTSKGKPQYKRFLDESKGKLLGNIWMDLFPVNSQAIEDTKYPTQKPEALLERIISASSNPGDLVFDCFMGSGTTQAVAMKLGRRFIGADINLGAIDTTVKRLINVAKEMTDKPPQLEFESGEEGEKHKVSTFYTGFEVFNVNHYDVFRNPVEAKQILLQALEVQALPGSASAFDGEKDGRMVKIMPVNRIATRADLDEITRNLDEKTYNKRHSANPTKPVELITLVCMGHEPDLAAQLKNELKPWVVDVEVVDILRDKANLEFKRDSELVLKAEKGMLRIAEFYPMNLLQKLSLQKESVDDWRELVDSVKIDWNYDGAIFEPKSIDLPGKDALVTGEYKIPDDAGTIRVKVTDLLSESIELTLDGGR